MVRLILTLAPIVCVLAAIAFSRLYDVYLKEDALTVEGNNAVIQQKVEKQSSPSKEKQLYDRPPKPGTSEKVDRLKSPLITMEYREERCCL